MIPLGDAADGARYGGKARGLALALRAGLPVPSGVALSPEDAAAVATRGLDDGEIRALAQLGVVAVRSSAIGEDGAAASFAGLHATVLGCATPDAVREAVRRVLASAHTKAALAYRAKLGLTDPPRMAVVVQRLVDAEISAIVFSRDPVTREDHLVVEATWGLGEALVQGLVNPDRFLLSRAGAPRSVSLGDKDLEIVRDGAALVEREVDAARRGARTLGDAALLEVARVVPAAEALVGGPVDLELAWRGGALSVLQARAITR